MATLAGINIHFPIYKDVNGVRTPFEDLVLKRSVVDSSLMSLSDNITGDVYYKDNTLAVSFREYIIYNDVKYILVNPPTVVREGMVGDNSDLRGMTKYSFTFYHPMCQLSNMPFTDVAVINTDARFRSESKSFSWVGHLDDFVAKLNKNLEGTTWVVKISERLPTAVVNTLSDVLTFDAATIADALKTMHDTWDVPFIIDSIKSGETYYNQGKRFQILVGLPSNEIYETAEDEQMLNHFVFRFGKGVGLKNNSATPRNNKIVTRIAGYGSENNIPYGYPQIVWYGNQDWDYTINNDPTNYNSYPIYKGIVGGMWVKLIKHPFTRKYLMPSVYTESVFNKVSPYLSDGTTNTNYNPNIELVDYYDAVDPQVYPNVIDPTAPSYEMHQFEDIKPELGEQRIVDAYPIDNNGNPASEWDDTDDGEGNYTQSYFKMKLPVLSFDLYACAAITEEMQINMRSGACIGCTFTVQVDWEVYKSNFYDNEGNFLPNGPQRNYALFPDSTAGQIEVILQKEETTFGVLMPNKYQYPKGETSVGAADGDQFVFLGISLPLSYITNAEARLDAAMASYMLENNIHYFDYPLKFDEKFLYEHLNILSQIRNNTIIHFEYAAAELTLYVKQITIKFGESPLPQYDITLTDDVEVVLNQIGQAQESISKLGILISELQQAYNRNVWAEIAKKLSKTDDDTARGKITFKQGADFGTFLQDVEGASIYVDEQGNWHIESDYVHARKKLVAKELQIEEISHIGGKVLLSSAEMVCSHVVEFGTYYRCYFLHEDDKGRKIYNKFKIGDQAIMQTFNVGDNETVSENRYFWRLVVGVGQQTGYAFSNDFNDDFSNVNTSGEAVEYYYIDLSKTDCDPMSDAPQADDKIIQLGYRYDNAPERQNAIMLAGAGEGSPYIDEYVGINSFTLAGKCKTRIKPNENFFTGRFDLSLDSTYGGRTISDLLQDYDLTEIMQQLEQMGYQLDTVQDDISELTTGNANLLRNTGFTGNYETETVSEEIGMRDDTEVYSDALDFWENQGAFVIADINSASGFSVVLTDGYIMQATTLPLVAGEWYNVSFRASGGHLTINVGGYVETIELDGTPKRYIRKFQCSDASTSLFSIQYANATVGEVQLCIGRVPNADWVPSTLDNPKAIAYYQDLVYLANAMINGSTSILGGLILTNQIRVGNYREKKLVQETGGMSGSWVNGNSPFLWGGGTMEQAFYTIGKFAENPAYIPTAAELAQMANFVVTHGGRAILNDIVLRGYIYALGGFFNGVVNANGGVFRNITSPNGNFSLDENGTLTCKDAKINGQLYTPMFRVTSTNWQNCLIIQPGGENYTLNILITGLNVQIDYAGMTGDGIIKMELPTDEQYVGARIFVMNNTNSNVAVVRTKCVMNMNGRVVGFHNIEDACFASFICFNDNNTIRWMLTSDTGNMA